MTRKKLLARKPLAELAAKTSSQPEKPKDAPKIAMNGMHTRLPPDPPGVQFVSCPWSPHFFAINDWVIKQVDVVGGYFAMEKRTGVSITELSIARCDKRFSKALLAAAIADGLKTEVLHFCMDAMLPKPPPTSYSHRPKIDAEIKRQEKEDEKKP